MFVPACADGGPLRKLYQIRKRSGGRGKFSKILPISGAGHEEMNMMRAYFSLIWPLWGDKFSVSHGWSSDNQKSFIREVKDTHKSADALRILMEGLLSEWLRHHYSKNNGAKSYACLIKDLLYFSEGDSVDMGEGFDEGLLRFGLAILAFREGVRKKDPVLVHAARVAFLPVWRTHSHPTYATIIPLFVREYSLLPDEVRESVDSMMVSSNTGTIGKCQGLDFIGEEYNKKMKVGLASHPSQQQWVQATRLQPVIDTIREKVDDYFGALPTDRRDRSPFCHYPDILSWRATLRLYRKELFETKTVQKVKIPSNFVGEMKRDLKEDVKENFLKDPKPPYRSVSLGPFLGRKPIYKKKKNGEVIDPATIPTVPPTPNAGDQQLPKPLLSSLLCSFPSLSLSPSSSSFGVIPPHSPLPTNKTH